MFPLNIEGLQIIDLVAIDVKNIFSAGNKYPSSGVRFVMLRIDSDLLPKIARRCLQIFGVSQVFDDTFCSNFIGYDKIYHTLILLLSVFKNLNLFVITSINVPMGRI